MSDTVLTPSELANFCDNIKLSDLNKIQSHGGLLVLDKKLHVIQYSENIVELLDTKIEQLLNSPVTAFLEPENAEVDIAAWLLQKNNQYKRIDWKSPQKKIKIWVYVHQVSEGIIIEIEPLIETDIEDNTLFDSMQNVVSEMRLTVGDQNIPGFIEKTCNEIQKLIRFDRVLVYQFDEQANSGVVVGEAIANDMESYLGLHFPATDVPQVVRDMYLKIPIRYIPSINCKLEKIIPEINPISKTYLDLSGTSLRMVAPVHREYLKNMGVECSVSVAIIHNNKLWGLIACHHKKIKHLSVNCRLILMLIGNMLGVQVASLVYSKEHLFEKRTTHLLGLLTKRIHKESSLLKALDYNHQNIMELVGATGMSIYFQNNLTSYGETPSQDQIMTLIEWLNTNRIETFCATPSLPLTFEPSMNYKNKACGLLVIPIIRLENHYMIFYRPEIIHSVFWGGNPSKVLKFNGDKYSPRDSFERFMETVTNYSAPWTVHDIKAAEFIRSTIVNKQLQDLLQVQAMHDPLTGLLNRLYLDERLEIELKRAERKSQLLTIILLDLDLFKQVNDDFGHQAGDYVLSEVANFLKKCFRSYDYIYRYGGEEFLILLPDTNGDSALQKADVLRSEIKKLKLTYYGIALPSISISAGIAVYPTNGSDVKSLISASDVALYEAKSTGRDKVICASTH